MIKTVFVIDYQACNLGSIVSAIKELDLEPIVLESPKYIEKLNCPVVLPGVGSFAFAMKSLRYHGWIDVLKEFEEKGKYPLVGICLGMQLFAELGTEGPELTDGLGFMRGKVVRLPSVPGERIPNIGWRRVESSTLQNHHTKRNSNFQYFVHSYYVSGASEEIVRAKIQWGDFDIPVEIQRGYLRGFQYHPEKGGKVGLRHFLSSLSF